MPTTTFSTGIPDLDDLLEGVRPGDNLVFHAADPALYRPFVQALAAWCRREKRRLVYLRVDGSLDEVLGDVPEKDVFDAAARRPSAVEEAGEGRLAADLKTYVQEKGRRVYYVCDSLTAMGPLLGGEEQLRAFFDELCPLLFELETVAYWLLLQGEHPPETIAAFRETTQVFLDLSAAGGETFLWPLKVLGRYSARMLTPHRLAADPDRPRLAPLTDEAAPYAALFREKGAELARSMSGLAEAQAQLIRQAHLIDSLLTALQSASAILGRTLDEREALAETLRLCDEVLGLKTGWIIRLGDEGRFSLAAGRGLPPALAAEDRAALRWTPCRCQRMLLAGELPRAVNVVACERLERAPGDRGGLKYHACAPIRAGERTWGLLNLAYPSERRLTPAELEALTALGAQLGVALERAEAHKRVRRQAAELSARQRVIEVILRTVDLEERLRIALQEILTLVGERGDGAQTAGEQRSGGAGENLRRSSVPPSPRLPAPLPTIRGAIYLVEEERLVLRVEQGFSKEFLALARDLPLEACPWARTSTATYAPWAGTDPITQALQREAVTAWISLPLIVEERLEGVLLLADRQTAALEADTLRALSALADQVAVALHNARLYAQSRERLARLATLREIDRAIAAQLALEEVVAVVLERVAPHIRVDAVGLSLIDWEKKRTILGHLHLPGGVEVRDEAFVLSDSLLEWLVVRQQPVMIYDLLGDPRLRGHRDLIRQHGLKSYLGVPLVAQDRAIGVLHVFTTEPYTFSAEEEDFFATMAGQTAISIQNARMYEAALRRGEALAALAQGTLALAQAGPESEAVQALLESACRATGADRGAWLTYDPASRALHPEALIGFPPGAETEPASEAIRRAEQGLSMPLGASLAPALAAVEGRPIYLKQTHDSPLWVDFDPSLRCAYCLPLIYSGRLYGVFLMLSEQEDAFSAEQRALADTFAAYAAGALNNAHLFHETRRQVAELEQRVAERTFELQTLYKLARSLGDATQFGDIIRLILLHLYQAIPYDVAASLLVTESAGTLVIQSRRPLSPGVEAQIRETLLGALARRRGQAPLPGEAALEVHRIQPGTEADAGPPLETLASSLEVPILVDETPVGLLLVAAEQAEQFDEEQARLLHTVADQAAESVRRLQSLLAAEHRRLESLVAHLPGGVVLLDAERRVVLANRAAQEFLVALGGGAVGERLTHLGGQPLEAALAPDPAGLPQEVEVAGPPRRVFEVAVRSLAVGPEAGGWLLVIQDVTEERAIRQRAQQQDRLAAVGQLAAGIAHDFNNILTSVIGLAELAHRDPNVPETVGKDLARIVQQGRRAAQLIRQILDFSRQSVTERRPVNLAPFVKETLKLLERTIPEDIRLVLEIEPGREAYAINADPAQMQQVLTNLALNARDAMPEGGTLRFRLSYFERSPAARAARAAFPVPPGEWIALSVSDTGAGISPDVLPRIYEPFFTTKETGEGTGMGLAQVYGIVKQHQGYIDVTSQVGQGTTFTLYLPAPQEALPEATVEETSQPRGHGETLLLVEDEPAVLEVAQAILEHLGYRVLTASNGREALAVYDRRGDDIALVLTDVTMPEIGGLALARALQEKNPDVKVVALTGYPLETEDRELLARGIVDWLPKPLNFEQLAQTVGRLLKPGGKTKDQ